MPDEREYNETESPDIDTLEKEELEPADNVGTTSPAKVIVFNDEWHTFDEVIHQIIKATACSQSKAEELTWEIHEKGKAVVYEGDMGKCLTVSSILEEIALNTQIEF